MSFTVNCVSQVVWKASTFIFLFTIMDIVPSKVGLHYKILHNFFWEEIHSKFDGQRVQYSIPFL